MLSFIFFCASFCWVRDCRILHFVLRVRCLILTPGPLRAIFPGVPALIFWTHDFFLVSFSCLVIMAPTRNSPDLCGVCKRNINAKFAPGIRCAGGCGWYHACCTDPPTSQENLRAHRDGKLDWVCDTCLTRDTNIGNATEILSSSRVDAVDPQSELRNDVVLLRTRCANLEAENSSLRSTIDTLLSRMSALEGKFDNLERKVESENSSPRRSMPGRSFTTSIDGPPFVEILNGKATVKNVGVPPKCVDRPTIGDRDVLNNEIRHHIGDRPLASDLQTLSNRQLDAAPQRQLRDWRVRGAERRVVMGSAKNSNPLPTIPKNRWLFVTRLSRSVTADQIGDYMADRLSSKRRPRCINLIPPENTERRVGSFRVELSPVEFEEALGDDFWDVGVLVMEYLFRARQAKPRKAHEGASGSPRTSAPAAQGSSSSS